MKYRLSKLLIFAVMIIGTAAAEDGEKNLSNEITTIVKDKKADVAVSIYSIATQEEILLNEKEIFPLQSVYKLHIVLALLDKLDKEQIPLSTKVVVPQQNLHANTWSPLRDENPDSDVTISFEKLIYYAIAFSDNNASDELLRIAGGTEAVSQYIESIGLKETVIGASEFETHQDMSFLTKNAASVSDATRLLLRFYNKEILRDEHFDFLWNILTETATGVTRLRSGLPSNVVLAHKTGSSIPDAHGMIPATNDIGIVKVNENNWYIISVFVCNSRESPAVNDKLIADISQAAWRYFSTKM